MLVSHQAPRNPEHCSPIRENSDNVRPAAQFLVLPPHDIGRVGFSPVRLGEVHVIEDVLHRLIQEGREARVLALAVQGQGRE